MAVRPWDLEAPTAGPRLIPSAGADDLERLGAAGARRAVDLQDWDFIPAEVVRILKALVQDSVHPSDGLH